MSIGVPVKLLHEAEGHTVTIELKTGELYRGKLIEAEDNMNCQVCVPSSLDALPFCFDQLSARTNCPWLVAVILTSKAIPLSPHVNTRGFDILTYL